MRVYLAPGASKALIAKSRAMAAVKCLIAMPLSKSELASLRKAAERGDALSQFGLGWALYQGDGLPLDYNEAARWLRLAADQGLAHAQHAMGKLNETGAGLPVNINEAARWYKAAFAAGFPLAQFDLGMMYALGVGMPQSDVNALASFKLACAGGYEFAQSGMEMVSAHMTQEQLAEADRRVAKWTSTRPWFGRNVWRDFVEGRR